MLFRVPCYVIPGTAAAAEGRKMVTAGKDSFRAHFVTSPVLAVTKYIVIAKHMVRKDLNCVLDQPPA